MSAFLLLRLPCLILNEIIELFSSVVMTLTGSFKWLLAICLSFMFSSVQLPSIVTSLMTLGYLGLWVKVLKNNRSLDSACSLLGFMRSHTSSVAVASGVILDPLTWMVEFI